MLGGAEWSATIYTAQENNTAQYLQPEQAPHLAGQQEQRAQHEEDAAAAEADAGDYVVMLLRLDRVYG